MANQIETTLTTCDGCEDNIPKLCAVLGPDGHYTLSLCASCHAPLAAQLKAELVAPLATRLQQAAITLAETTEELRMWEAYLNRAISEINDSPDGAANVYNIEQIMLYLNKDVEAAMCYVDCRRYQRNDANPANVWRITDVRAGYVYGYCLADASRQEKPIHEDCQQVVVGKTYEFEADGITPIWALEEDEIKRIYSRVQNDAVLMKAQANHTPVNW